MSDQPSKFNFKTFFPTILFIATVGLVTTDIYLPSFPAITKELATKNSLVQLSFSLYLLTFSLSQLFYGPYSEKHGRKKITLFGLGFSLIGSLICVFSPNITILIMGRLLQGLGLGIGPALFRAILRDAFKGDFLAHTSSLIAIGTACLMAVAPTIGGYIESYLGWRYNFVFIIGYTLFGMLLIWRWLPETLEKPNPLATKPKTILTNFSTLLRSPVFLGYALCGCLAFAGLTAYLTVSPFLFQNIIGLSPVEYGWLALVVAAGVAAGGFFNSRLVKKVGRHLMLLYGILLMVAGGLAMLLLGLKVISTLTIIVPMFFYITGVGIAVGNCNAGALHHFPLIAGFAGASYGMLQIFGSSVVTSLMAALHERSQIPLGIVLLVIGIGCYFFQRMGYRAQKKLEQL